MADIVLNIKSPNIQPITRNYKNGITIGRRVHDEDDVDLSFPDRTVSKQHARIWIENGTCHIQDLGSALGTKVDGEDIGLQPLKLFPGSKIQIGPNIVHFVSVDVALLLEAEIQGRDTFNYSLLHAVPFLKSVTLKNLGTTSLRNPKVKVTLPGFFEAEGTLFELQAGGSFCLDELKVSPNKDRFADLLEPDSVGIEVKVNNQPIGLAKPFQVTILPPGAWYSGDYPEVLAAFVLKDCRTVRNIIKKAQTTLRCLIKDVRTFEDLVRLGHPHAESVMKSLYICLQERFDISYGREPRSYAPDWQKIRFPADIHRELGGTCIDLALLFAACLENRHLNPVLILIAMPGGDSAFPTVWHAIIGCWRGHSRIDKNVEWNGEAVWKRVKAGDLLVLDSIGFAHGQVADQLYEECRERGKELLRKATDPDEEKYRFVYAVDVYSARLAGVLPLPLGDGVQMDREVSWTFARARQEATRSGDQQVGARHLLLAAFAMDNSILSHTFDHLAKNGAAMVTEKLQKSSKQSQQPPATFPLPLTANAEGVQRRAKQLARQKNTDLVTMEELIIALLQSKNVKKLLKRQGWTVEQCVKTMQTVLESGLIPSRWGSSAFLSESPNTELGTQDSMN